VNSFRQQSVSRDHCNSNRNSNNQGIYIAHATGRPRAHHKTSQPVVWCPNTESHTNVFSFVRNEYVDRSSFSCVGSLSHARGAATEKALSPIRRHVRGMTRLPHDEACSVDRTGISVTVVTGVSKAEMCSVMLNRLQLCDQRHRPVVTLSAHHICN